MQTYTTWTLSDAEKFILAIQDMLASLGVSAHIVGSVAKVGSSKNDLDIVLKPVNPMTLDMIIERIESQLLPIISKDQRVNPLESAYCSDAWFLNIELLDGRIVEFYLDESDFPLEEKCVTISSTNCNSIKELKMPIHQNIAYHVTDSLAQEIDCTRVDVTFTSDRLFRL